MLYTGSWILEYRMTWGYRMADVVGMQDARIALILHSLVAPLKRGRRIQESFYVIWKELLIMKP